MSHLARPRRGAVQRWMHCLMPAAVCLLVSTAPVVAGTPQLPQTARDGLVAATTAAHGWAPDAQLVYVENDATLTPQGTSMRWGYLFHSPTTDRVRAYSVESGRIVVAGDPGLQFESPPIEGDWVDSAQALAAAEDKKGRVFRSESGGQLETVLLVRGVFDHQRPDRMTWTVVYRVEDGPSLFVVVDAATGKVVRTWRG